MHVEAMLAHQSVRLSASLSVLSLVCDRQAGTMPACPSVHMSASWFVSLSLACDREVETMVVGPSLRPSVLFIGFLRFVAGRLKRCLLVCTLAGFIARWMLDIYCLHSQPADRPRRRATATSTWQRPGQAARRTFRIWGDRLVARIDAQAPCTRKCGRGHVRMHAHSHIC